MLKSHIATSSLNSTQLTAWTNIDNVWKIKGPKSSEKILTDQIQKIKYLEGLKTYLSLNTMCQSTHMSMLFITILQIQNIPDKLKVKITISIFIIYIYGNSLQVSHSHKKFPSKIIIFLLIETYIIIITIK